jgi:lysophospholipase L1-like esterase
MNCKKKITVMFKLNRNTMLKRSLVLAIVHLFFLQTIIAQTNDYLKEIKDELKKEWPHNRTINLVFHGHSVPTGYFRTPEVRTFDSYPFVLLKELKAVYPNAVINVITTSIGGENSTQGAKRFKKDVLIHKPDVLFIDYALNDRSIGLEQSKKNLEKMIKQALKKGIKIILMTPSPDISVDFLKPGSELDLFAQQIRSLAAKYKIGVVDSFGIFKQVAGEGKNIKDYMAQSNHPNEKGHQLIADGIMQYFK